MTFMAAQDPWTNVEDADGEGTSKRIQDQIGSVCLFDLSPSGRDYELAVRRNRIERESAKVHARRRLNFA